MKLPTVGDSAPCGCGHTLKQHAVRGPDPLWPCLVEVGGDFRWCDCIAFQIADPLPCGHPASEWTDEDLNSTDHFVPNGCRACREEEFVNGK
jgi:hypothetical protein